MNIATTLKMRSTSSKDTVRLAEQIGSRLKGGEVIELVSDLGGGKTTFVRGLARGAGSQDHVASPTFTISRVYKAKELNLHHFDFYRLSEAGIIQQELEELLNDEHSVVIVEWGDVVRGVLPDERLVMTIKTLDENSRELTFTCAEKLSYIVKGIS